MSKPVLTVNADMGDQVRDPAPRPVRPVARGGGRRERGGGLRHPDRTWSSASTNKKRDGRRRAASPAIDGCIGHTIRRYADNGRNAAGGSGHRRRDANRPHHRRGAGARRLGGHSASSRVGRGREGRPSPASRAPAAAPWRSGPISPRRPRSKPWWRVRQTPSGPSAASSTTPLPSSTTTCKAQTARAGISHMAVNLRAPFVLMQTFAAALPGRGGGLHRQHARPARLEPHAAFHVLHAQQGGALDAHANGGARACAPHPGQRYRTRPDPAELPPERRALRRAIRSHAVEARAWRPPTSPTAYASSLRRARSPGR